MNLVLTEKNRGKLFIETGVISWANQPLLPGAIPFTIIGDNFLGMVQALESVGTWGWLSSYAVSQPSLIHASGDIPLLEIRIALKNCISGQKFGECIADLWEAFFLVSWSREVDSTAAFRYTGNFSTLDIHVTPEFLQGMGYECKSLDRFIYKVQHALTADLSIRPILCSKEMKEAVYNIIYANYDKTQSTVTLHDCFSTIITEALRLSLLTETYPLNLHPGLIERLDFARSLIDEAPINYLGNEYLRTQAGLNSRNLIEGFKALYGLTPKQYHKNKELEISKQLLRDGAISKTISYSLGFEKPTSFSKEFRKHYLISPKQYQLSVTK